MSIDDLQTPQFADLLAGIAETCHLDKTVSSAFVGSEEERLEDPQNPILPVELDLEGPNHLTEALQTHPKAPQKTHRVQLYR